MWRRAGRDVGKCVGGESGVREGEGRCVGVDVGK